MESYRWSSYGEYLKAPGRRVCWLRVDRLLGEWRLAKDSPVGRKQFGLYMEQRKGDPEKVAIAWRVRQETTMRLKWVARRLRMGSWTYVSNCLVQKENECRSV